MKLIKLPDGWDVMPFDELQKKMIVPPLPGGVGDSNKAGAKPKAKRNPSLSHVCKVCSYKYDRAERLSAHMLNKHGSTTTTQSTTGQHSSHSGYSTAQPTVVAHLQQQQQQQEFVCPLGMFVYYGEQVEEVEQVEQVEEAEEAEDPLAA